MRARSRHGRKWGRIISTASAHSLVASPFKSATLPPSTDWPASQDRGARSRNLWRRQLHQSGYVWTRWWKPNPGPNEDPQHDRRTGQHDILLAAQPAKQFVTVDQVASLRFISVRMRHPRSPALIIDRRRLDRGVNDEQKSCRHASSAGFASLRPQSVPPTARPHLPG